MSYTWRFDVVWDYRAVFLRGVLVTGELTGGASRRLQGGRSHSRDLAQGLLQLH